ncbi:MAG: NTP transferase domain-containing protein [Pyrinomonadaceae bacterium]|nr:NTP transferase domain-containing protein [Pyrinomonadaceae bacterium]
MNTSDLQQLSDITRTRLSAELRELTHSSAELTALEYVLGESGAAQPSLPRTVIYLLHRMYGPDNETLNDQLQRLTSMCAQFVELYGEGPVSVLRAPARINILGEHVDYVSYLRTASLSFGSREHDMLMLYRASETDRIRGASTLEEYPPFAFTLAEGPSLDARGAAETDWLSYLYEDPTSAPHWSNYVRGAAYFARIRWGARARRGFDFVVDSGIPAGGGASSSSALVVLASAAMQEVNRLGCDPIELARDAAKAEWYVGTRGGSMDHITICLAKRDHAVLISYPEKQARQVALPGRQFRWITFFSQPADKGRGVMIEYNERAAISRIVIPALIEGWRTKQPERYAAWLAAIQSLQTGSAAALDEIERLLQELPCALTLTEIERDYPEAFSACARAFPALVAERGESPLQVRARALHHAGEVRRVATVAQVLESLSSKQTGSAMRGRVDEAMRELGSIFNQSHQSLRDLYGVSTSEVERLTEIIRADRSVYGTHLMGGGFGGNVLALTSEENEGALIERVQTAYYEPQNRQGVQEGSVMISTAGDGLAPIDVESVWREAVEQFNSSDRDVPKHRARIAALLDSMLDETPGEVWPVIVAAGKGTRARGTGLDVPKPLAAVLGEPAIVHVLRNVRTAFGATRPPIAIVSPESQAKTRDALAGDDVTFVVQPEALGTGDAVLCAHKEMRDFQGRALVIWGTQPVIRPETMQRTLKLAALFEDYEMVVPTAHLELPYAPLLRDERGRVQSAYETHLERVERPASGESNIGMFLLKSEAMFEALVELKQRHWDETQRRYKRYDGELGFPNELINYLAGREAGVFACPIADSREEQGIKKLEDLARCERFIGALALE